MQEYLDSLLARLDRGGSYDRSINERIVEVSEAIAKRDAEAQDTGG